ncbi:MAG: hypothetical protein R3284_11055, partial [Rubricoccaceae bacterium]|nr:hypothetical protein [Rubricoccaceae bacterium]
RNRLTMTFSMSSNNAENGLTLRALTPEGLVSDPVVRPTLQRSYTTRGTLQLSRNHNLNTSYQFGNQHGENQNVGDFGLPEQGNTNDRDNFTYQVKETAVLSGSFNNEARFQVNQFEIAMTPITAAPYVNVLGAFRSGGSPNNRDTKVRQFDFGDLLMYTGRNLQLRFGYDGGESSPFLVETIHGSDYLGCFLLR